MNTLQFKKTKFVKSPNRGSKMSAGVDLYSPEKITLLPGKATLIEMGITFTFPQGTYGRIAPRSGLALRHNIWINGGVIDPDYTGEIKIIMINLNSENYYIQQNDKICQIICEKIQIPTLEEVDYINETERSNNGFGSTGK